MAPSAGRFSGIFLCYRRDDSAGHAGRLYDQLVRYFGDDHVFMDLDRIEPGEDFEVVIGDAVGSCETLIVLIGRDWLTSRDEKRRRLDNPKDFVRLEIAAALERNVRVIPVLLQGATMPGPEDLPDELSRFSRRQAFDLSDRRWKQDVARLINSLERTLEVRRIIAPHTTAQSEAERQRHKAEEPRAQAEGNESDELTVEAPPPTSAATAKPVVRQRADEPTQVAPLFAPASKPVAREWSGEHKVVQAQARPARFTKPSPMILAALALGVAGIVCAALIIWRAVESQNAESAIASAAQAGQLSTDSNSQPLQLITPTSGQAEQNAAPAPAATPKTRTNTNLQPEVGPTPSAKTATPPATPKATPQATPAAVSSAKPTRAATPAESYASGVKLWSSNRGAALKGFRAAAAAGNLDAHYYLGLNLVEGRKAGSLKRAEVVAALQHFNLARRGSRHAWQARGYVQQLEKEFDRLRR